MQREPASHGWDKYKDKDNEYEYDNDSDKDKYEDSDKDDEALQEPSIDVIANQCNTLTNRSVLIWMYARTSDYEG